MNKKNFLEKITELLEKGTSTSVEDLFTQVPDTPDNLDAIKYLSIQESDHATGVGVSDGVLASSLINTLEDAPMPAVIKLRYPRLNEKEWASALRYCTLVLCALEGDKSDG